MIRSKAWLLLSALLLSSFATTSAAAQAEADVVKALQDSITKLNTKISDARNEVANASLPYPDAILSVSRSVADDHAFFKVTLNRVGRVVVRVTRDGTTNTETGKSMEFSRDHVVRVDNLSPGQSYTADLVVLRNDLAETEGTTRQTGRTGVAGWPNNPLLKFSTPSAYVAPNLSLAGGPPANPVIPPSFSVTVNSNQPVLIRGEIFRVSGGVRSETATDIDGQAFTLDEFGIPIGGGFTQSKVITFTGLEANTTYQYVIRAINQQGKQNVLSVNPGGYDQVATGVAIPEFAFDSTLKIRIRPAEGLVVEWGSTVAATAGSLKAEFVGVPGAYSLPATALPGNPRRMQATIPLTALGNALAKGDPDPNNPPPPPLVTVSMTGPSGVIRTLAFSIALELPKERNAIDAAPVLTAAQKASVKRVWDGLRDAGRNVNWRDVGVTALKFIGAAAIP